MTESPQQKARPTKSRSRRSRLTKVSSDKEVSSRSKKAASPNKSRNLFNDTSRNETAVDITHYECELDNDTTDLMARLEKRYERNVRKHINTPAAAVTPPTMILANEQGEKARLARWEETQELEESTTDEEAEEAGEQSNNKRPSLQPQPSARTLRSQVSTRTIQSEAMSQAPSVISEQYLESVEDLPFDDDSFVPLMVISPIQCRRSSGLAESGNATRSSSSRHMQGIQEMSDSHETDEIYPPPVSEIDLAVTDNTDASAAGYQSEKLSQFLKASGQDDQVAAATAQAFEAFLLSQEQAMLQLIPEDDIYGADDDTSLTEDYHPLEDDPVRAQSDENIYAKLAAIQMGMNQAHGQVSSKSSRDLGRSHNQVHARRHETRRGRHASDKENNQNYRGIPRQARKGDRYVYESREAHLNESFANQASIGPYEDYEDDHVSRQSSHLATRSRLGRHESIRSNRSERRNLGSEFDHFGRIRQNDSIAAEPSREKKIDQYRGIRQSGRVQNASISSNMVSYSRGNNGSVSQQPSLYEVALGKPQSVGSGSSTWSGRTSPPVSVRSERTLTEQIESLPVAHRACYNALKSKWEIKSGGKKAFPDELYLRFAMCSSPPFDFKSAWAIMKRFDRRYLNLSVTSLEKQLLTKTIFPLAGLKSRTGNDMLYMRLSRFFPGKESTDKIIDNLVYAMGSMLEREQACIDGIGVIANMTDWKMSNFSVKYWHKLMATLQGRRVPTRVSMLLIVNPPSWFGSIWTIMRPMLGEPLRSNVYRIPFHEMDRYLMNGFERFMPDEMHTGSMKTSRIVKDFIAERKRIEKMQRA